MQKNVWTKRGAVAFETNGVPPKKRGVTVETVKKWVVKSDREMDKSVWLRYDKVDRGMWLVSRRQTAFTVKAVWLREASTWQCCVSAEFNEKL